MFCQGLKPKVKKKLMRTAAFVNTFNTLVNKAISINIWLHKLQ